MPRCSPSRSSDRCSGSGGSTAPGSRCAKAHDQAQGALTRIVVVSAMFGLAAFFLWYTVIGQAYLIPFMPTR